MKKQDITYQDKLNELRLDISHPNSRGLVFIFVEGDSDIRLFRKFFNLKNCKVENIPGGKSKLEDGIYELLKIYNLIIGIRDADFIHLNEMPYSKSNIFLTDAHDIEMCIISEDELFSNILSEFTDIPVDKHNDVRSNILKSIEEISLLKWLNDIENLEIKFEGTGFRDIIVFANSNINFREYFTRILGKSPNAVIKDLELVIKKINALKVKNPNDFQLCNGHDFIQALSQFIREKYGKGLGDDYLASICRINYNNIQFSKSNLYNETNKWALENNLSIYL